MLVAAVALAPGCTSRTWDTSEVDNPTTTTVRQYTLDDAGLTASLTDYLSMVGEDLNEWAAPAQEAECAAGRIVRQLTVDHLLDLGFDPQSPTLALAYPAEERVAVINMLVGCIDFSQSVVELFSSYGKLPLTRSDCIAQGFERRGLVRDLAGSLIDGVEPDPFANANRFSAGLSDLAADCLEADDLVPGGLMPAMPEGETFTPGSTTSTTLTPILEDPEPLEGIEPGGPLDTTTTSGG